MSPGFALDRTKSARRALEHAAVGNVEADQADVTCVGVISAGPDRSGGLTLGRGAWPSPTPPELDRLDQ